MLLLACALWASSSSSSRDEAQTPPSPSPTPAPPHSEYVEVTATRVPEDAEEVPASVTVIAGRELVDRGAVDLHTALALAAGVDIAPGGDGGPASSVPEVWGLKEFDAFLLVVDGVPWGGAFNPALGTLDLNDVERIEILRGAAPVMYGATSFVGVVHVIHKPAGTPGGPSPGPRGRRFFPTLMRARTPSAASSSTWETRSPTGTVSAREFLSPTSTSTHTLPGRPAPA